MKQKILLLLLLTGFITNISLGQIDTTNQLYINQDYSNIEMISDFFDGVCIELSNVNFTGADGSAAFFDAGNTDLGVNFGIVLSTGNVASVSSPSSDLASTAMGLSGDPDLENLSFPLSTLDAVVLEFDFVALATDTIFFEYVFASEEYPEYALTNFTDVFAFFVTDANGNTLINRALTPNSQQFVSVGTVNDVVNPDLYIPYETEGGNYHVFDGMTIPLPAVFAIEEGASYSAKIAISDVSDSVFDSAVFIGVGSLCSDDVLEPVANFLVEKQDSLNIKVTNNSLYSTSMFVDFGDGNTLTTSDTELTYSYDLPGNYIVETIAMNSCCNANQENEINIEDPVNVGIIDTYGFSFGPNPVRDELWVELNKAITTRILIYDTYGRTVLDREINSSGNLDLSLLNDGLYTIVLKSEEQMVTNHLVKK